MKEFREFATRGNVMDLAIGVPAPAAATTTKECPRCLSVIPQKATRCPQCTSDVA
jgi:hypothetical protein